MSVTNNQADVNEDLLEQQYQTLNLNKNTSANDVKHVNQFRDLVKAKIVSKKYTTDGNQIELNLNIMKDDDWPIVIEQIQNKECPLRGLSLSWNEGNNKMIEPGFIELMKIIESHQTLIHLRFSIYSASKNTKTNLVLETLKTNHTIQDLSVDSTDLDDKAQQVFSEVLKDNQSLLSLNFHTCSYVDPREPSYPMKYSCATELSRSLPTSVLQRLKIDDIDDRSLNILMPSLPKTLYCLDLSGNTFGSEDISIVQSHFQSNANTLKVVILNSSTFEKFKQSKLPSKAHVVSCDSFQGNLFSLKGSISIKLHSMNETDWSMLSTELTKNVNNSRQVDLNLSNEYDENSMNYLKTLLGKQSRLTNLKVSSYSLNQSVQEKLFHILRKNKSIHIFEIEAKIDLNIINYIFDFLVKNNNIVQLKLSNCLNMGDQEAFALVNGLKRITNLKSFQVNFSNIGDSGFQGILSSLPDSLIELHITNSCVSAKSLPLFWNFIKTHPRMKDISLENNPITISSAPELDVPDLIEQILKTTNANHCNCYLEIYTKIQDIVSNPTSTCIWLPKEHRRDYDLIELYNGLKKNPNRTWALNMSSSSNMSLKGYGILLDILSSDIRITKLHLGEDDMNEEVQKYFFKGLYNNKTVEHLEITKNKLSSRAMKYIGSFLQNSSKLELLKLDRCEIDSDGIRYLSKGLSESYLKILYLTGNSLDDRSCTRILSSIPSTLKVLSLRSDEIADSCFQSFSHFLNTNQTLEELNLNGNPIYHNRSSSGDEYIEQLKRVAKQNGICKLSTNYYE